MAFPLYYLPEEKFQVLLLRLKAIGLSVESKGGIADISNLASGGRISIERHDKRPCYFVMIRASASSADRRLAALVRDAIAAEGGREVPGSELADERVRGNPGNRPTSALIRRSMQIRRKCPSCLPSS